VGSHSAAPGGGSPGRDKINGNSQIIALHPPHGITGLYFTMPEWWQGQRIAELSLTLSAHMISIITRRPYRETVSIMRSLQGRCGICGLPVLEPWLWLCERCRTGRAGS